MSGRKQACQPIKINLKPSLTKFAALLAAGLLAALAMPAHAVVYQIVTNAPSYNGLDGFIVTNLLQAGQGSLASVVTSHAPQSGWLEAGLNDGAGNAAAGGQGGLTHYPNPGNGSGSLPVTITFNLNTNNGTGGATNGYDINFVQCISGWNGGYFANQNFQLLLSLNGGPFNNYGGFVGTSTLNSGNNSVMTTVASSSGPIARNVTAIQYVFTPSPTGNGAVVIHELQAFGTPSPTNALPAVPYRICAVGDSITAGYTDPSAWTQGFQFGYRSGLMTRLATNSLPFQFVGYSPQPWSGTDGTVTNIPSPDLRIAGQNNFEGYSGKNTTYFLSNINGYMAVDQPDIMLLMASINDISTGSTGEPTGAEQNLSNIVATVVNQSPNTRVIVAQITPYVTYTAAITLYNNYIANVLVPYFVGQGKYVTTVNQYTNMCVPGTTNIDATLFSNGNNHPNYVAYDRMAKTWFDGIKALSLPATPLPCAINANLVINGGFELPRYTANSHNLLPQGGGWAFTWNSSTACAGIDYGTSIYGTGQNAYDGNQRGTLQSGNSQVQHISQAVSGFVVGQTYQLSFWAEGINGYTFGSPFHASLINGASTNVLLCNGTNTIVPPSGSYAYYTSAPFVASNTVMTLDFSDNGLSVGTYVSWIDDVAIYAMPASALVSTQQVGTSQNSLDGAIAVNLIRAGQQTLGSVSASHIPASGWNTSSLNDGSAAANANLTYYANVDGTGNGLPVVLTFNLNTNSLTGGSAHGYTINSVQALTGWTDSYLANQTFQLLLSINGGAYASYGTYLSGTVTNGGQSSILETVSGNGGPIATNVTGVQYVFLAPGGPQGGGQGTVIRELQVFGSSADAIVPAPQLVTDTLPFTAANVVGDQVVFTAVFSNAPAATYQWQKISAGATNDIANATNTTLTLNNLQTTNTASYRLKAVNATNSAGVSYSTPSPLTVSSVPSAVNNVITRLAAQTGFGPASVVGISFTPTWTVTTNNSIIAGTTPSSSNGNFSLEATGRSVNSLTAGGNGTIALVSTGTSTNYVTCGNAYGSGSSVTYTLTGSVSGYDLTNLTVYGGWADAGRDQQAYTVYYSTVALPTTFISLGSVNYNPANTANTESATRATLVPAAGVLAANVVAVKFDFTTPASENGYCGYSQIALFGTVSAPLPITLNLNHFPRPMQVCQRNLATGYAQVLVDGAVTSTGCTQIAVSVLRNGLPYTNMTQSVTYLNGTAPFSITVPILAELASYTVAIYGTQNGTNYLVTTANDVVAGDVFLISGQSNAEAAEHGTDSSDTNQSPYLRSFGTRDDSGATVAADLNWHLAEGDVTYGPGVVGQWGLHLGRRIIDTYGIPVAIINGARGGWPITSFQRNDANPQDLNTDYGRTLFRAAQAGVQGGVRVLLWYQGESDNGDADAHQKGWSTLHDNWRKDFPSIEKFYVFQLHVGCGVSQFDTDLRNRQRLFADQFNDVEVMSTTAVGQLSEDCHYPYAGGYQTHGDNIFRLIQRDLYGDARSNIEAPNPYYAYFSTPAHDHVTVIMRTTNDTLAFTTGAESDFRLEGSAVVVAIGSAVSNTLVLTLSGDASAATGLSYGGHIGAAAPAITNTNGVGLLAFYNLPIQPGVGAPGVPANVASLDVCAGRVDLTWAATTNAAEYLIRRNGVVIGQTTTLTVFSDSTVTAGPVYNYDIAAVGLGSTSAWSTVTSVTTVPDNVFAFVPEATNYTILYRLDIPNDLRLGSTLTAPYAVDNSALITRPFDRVAYYLELQANPGQPLSWVYVSCNPFSPVPKLLGVPSVAAGGIFHQPITNLNVSASAGSGVATGSGLGVGNLEFWGWNYTQGNTYGVPGASDSTYDSGDAIVTNGTYGSMQMFLAGQTLFAYNAWGAYSADTGTQSSDDLGIGTQAAGQPDWTFAANCFRYSYKCLYVLVHPMASPLLGCTLNGPLANGGQLQFSWPAGNTGWRLQTQTNSAAAGLGTNWFTVSGSTATNQMTIPVASGVGSVFFRLVYP